MRWQEQINGKREPDPLFIVAGAMSDRSAGAAMIEPGQWVRHPDRPEWGIGQVQSAIGARITVNFEDQGKVLINAERIELVVLE